MQFAQVEQIHINFFGKNFEIITMRKKINIVFKKINIENSDQKFLLRVNFGGADSIKFIFGVNLNFCIVVDNFSTNLSKSLDIFSLKY